MRALPTFLLPKARSTAGSPWAVCGFLCAVAPAVAGASETTQVDAPEILAQIQPLDRFQAEQERLREILKNQPPAYTDRVMEENSAGTAQDAETPPPQPPDGLRAWLIEGRLGWNEQEQSGLQARSNTEAGIRLEYREESLNHGEWILQADTRRQSQNSGSGSSTPFYQPTQERQSGRLTLRNQGFPVTPFVFADSALGDLASEVTDGLSRGQRLSLGNSTVRGASVRVFAREFDVRAGMGQRGQLAGGPYPGFERTQGELAWAGYTHRFDDLNYAAVQVNRATDTPWPFVGTGTGVVSTARTTSMAATVGRGYTLDSDGDRRYRLTLLHSESQLDTGDRHNAQGYYFEGGLRTGRFRHEAGLYSTQPRLRFGDQWVADGARGVFWRMDHSESRLNWGFGLDHEHQPAESTFGSGFTRTGVNANWQYRINRNSSWGGYLQHSLQRTDNLVGGTTGQRSSYGSVSYQDRWSDWGDSRLRLTVRRNQALVSNAPSATGEEVEWEQDWLRRQPGSLQSDVLRTTLGWARDRSAGDTQTYPTAGLTWQTWIESGWNLSTHLRYTSRSGNLATSRGLSGALQTEKRLTPSWTLGASAMLNQAVVNINGAGLLPGTATVSRSNDKTALVFLRYEAQQGQPYGFGLRGAQGAGAGRISGVVFFDSNRDGVQQADEAGVPGVEVLLNQRSRVVTDDRGRYTFSVVATGTQRLSLRPESVPLPWGEGPQSQTSVDVPLRGEAIAPLAVVKTNE